jgi:ABC-type bacteriocin/lantibiotic exporter with double-glycine peptidase domain
MIYLSQRDFRWGDRKIGESSLTLAKFGCTTTSISMLSDYFGHLVLPSQIASDVNFYTKDGLVIWKNLSFDKFKFVERTFGRDDARIKQALKDPNQAVIFNVNNGAHWVVGVRPTLIGNSYIVVDPWNGKKCDVIKTYKNITGCAYFARK